MRTNVVIIAGQLALLASLGAGCGGSDCPPLVEGSPFGHEGTALIQGAATIPESVPDDMNVQLLISEQGSGFRVGVIPENLLEADTPTTCGTDLEYEISGVEAGTYSIFIDVTDPGADFVTVFESTADKIVTVGDDEAVEVDLAF